MILKRALYLLALACVASCLAPTAALATFSSPMSELSQDLAIAYAYTPGACTRRTSVLWGRLAPVGGVDTLASAVGATFYGDGTFARQSCTIEVDRDAWTRLDGIGRCKVVVHEVRHLYGYRHTRTGIMSARMDLADFAPCDVREPAPERAQDMLVATHRGWSASCDDPYRLHFRCWIDQDHGHDARAVPYRVTLKRVIGGQKIVRITRSRVPTRARAATR